MGRMKALITGSGGLIGSECVRLLSSEGWEVVGIDNDMRRVFFGDAGSTEGNTGNLKSAFPLFRHIPIDIRDRQAVRDLMERERPEFIVHTAAQPSHDKAAAIPYEDFDVNAVGTLNLLVAARDFCRDSPFCFTSTNKVYGDRPNTLPLDELEKRYDYANGLDGIDETMSNRSMPALCFRSFQSGCGCDVPGVRTLLFHACGRVSRWLFNGAAACRRSIARVLGLHRNVRYHR